MKKLYHAIHTIIAKISSALDCFASLAMTRFRNFVIASEAKQSRAELMFTMTRLKNFFIQKVFILTLIVMCISPLSSIAAEDMYQFTTSEQQQRFTTLTTQLRCLVCQNQNIAQSNSSLANDLRDQIYQKILHGQSNQEIIDYLSARYGDYILYRPPFDYATLGLWLGPFIILLGGVSYLLFYVRKKSREKTE